ncbi:methylmalonyl-CoA mutase family protein [Paraburkholderia atlantica]|uniref:methylmalonyl-CoA mutase family protein n=1 Tax=Paraburkholderia atlantica TaxID=2654982 RepID=UPI00160F24E9|nr:methylmalonyl-CoA mutase family protein [Paraburkholderia atlantica]MBB5509308.1 methylmalonyl-CoA mutase [Paraburkholderia atlantica]
MNANRTTRSRPVSLKPVYTCADLEGLARLDSMPGEAPFVRGPFASMYTERPWTIRQYGGYAQAADSNRAFRTALTEGAQGLSVAFDLPTQRGYDSDDPRVSADVGMTGVAIDTVEDMARLFEGIALDRISVSMTMNGAVLPVLAAFIVAAEESGVRPSQLTGTIQNDILKEFIVRNTCIFAPEPSLRIVTDVVAYLATAVPRFNALSVSGYHFQEAGADAVLELALTMANARTYVDALIRQGMEADHVCERMSFFFGVGTDFYVEIAKLRAARLVWSTLARESGARSNRACALRMHCQTSGWSLTAHKPMNNVVRTAIEARDTQLVLQHETGVCDVVDPWAGSYMMESLTADIANRVRLQLDEIEARGGVMEAIHSGWIRERIRHSALGVQAEIESRERAILGVNCFERDDDDAPIAISQVDVQQIRRHQARRIAEVKAARDSARVRAALGALERAARDGAGNLLELTIECMRARATVGECTQALEAVWPRHPIQIQAAAGQFGERLSADPGWSAALKTVKSAASQLGRAPRVLIAKLGQDGHDRGVSVVAAALADAGFDVVTGQMFASAAETGIKALKHDVDVIGVSSLAGAHVELASLLIDDLQARNATIPIVVGGNIDDSSQAVLKRLGVAECFPTGTSVAHIVAKLAGLSCRGLVERPNAFMS